RRESAAMVLRTVARLEAEYGARVLQVAIAPPVVGDDEEDVEPDRRRLGDTELEQPHDVALAAPDREVPHRDGTVFHLDPADADADRGEPVRVRIVARDRFAPDLAGTVEPVRTRRRLVGQRLPRARLGVAPGDQLAVGRVTLPGAHGRPARGVHDATNARPTRGLEDVVGADDVSAQDRLEGFDRAGDRRQVDDRVDTLEGRRDRVEVGYVGLVALHPGHGAAVERPEVVRAF